jgi:hypothetical protein
MAVLALVICAIEKRVLIAGAGFAFSIARLGGSRSDLAFMVHVGDGGVITTLQQEQSEHNRGK